MRTCDEAGDDEREDEHLEDAHEDVARERDEHDDLLGRREDARDEADDEAEEHRDDGEHEQQVLAEPLPRLRASNNDHAPPSDGHCIHSVK